MRRQATITETITPMRKAILGEMINTSQRVIERENSCSQEREVEINYSVLAQGLLKKYKELVACYPNSSSELLQELRKKLTNIQQSKNPSNNMELVFYLCQILLNKEE